MSAPAPRLLTLPPAAYVDPAVYERELERLLRPGWTSVARTDQLAEPGDYVAFELFGEPLVAVRGDDGAIRVLSRVCRHRWMPIVAPGAGRRRSFQCPYHLWTYGLDGRLVGAPDMQATPGFDRARCALPALRGMLWYRLEPLAVDRFRLSIHPCVPPESVGDRAWADGVAALRGFVEAVHRQDIEACQGVQQGLRARLAAPGALSQLEMAVARLAAWWRARMDS